MDTLKDYQGINQARFVQMIFDGEFTVSMKKLALMQERKEKGF